MGAEATPSPLSTPPQHTDVLQKKFQPKAGEDPRLLSPGKEGDPDSAKTPRRGVIEGTRGVCSPSCSGQGLLWARPRDPLQHIQQGHPTTDTQPISSGRECLEMTPRTTKAPLRVGLKILGKRYLKIVFIPSKRLTCHQLPRGHQVGVGSPKMWGDEGLFPVALS